MSVTRKIPFWLAILIVLIAAIIVVLIVSILVYERVKPPSQPTTPTTPAEKIEVYSYIGQIQTIGDKSLTILALANKNQSLTQDTTIAVNVTDKTKYVGMSIPKTLPKNPSQEELNELFKSQDITFNDLQVGDEVTVVSLSDVFGKTEMTATKVQKMSVAE